jgi:hypothetical protein
VFGLVVQQPRHSRGITTCLSIRANIACSASSSLLLTNSSTLYNHCEKRSTGFLRPYDFLFVSLDGFL